MAQETPAPKTRAPRKPRRNFEKQLTDLRTYVGVKLEVLSESRSGTGPSFDNTTINARIAELEAVLARIPQ